MTPYELYEIVVSSGHNARVRGKEVQLQACVFCGNARWNLELAAAQGVYHCWACRQSGRVDALLSLLTGRSFVIETQRKERPPVVRSPGRETFRAVSALEMEGAAKYLQQKRGLTREDILRYDLQVCVEKAHRLYGRITIPLRDFWTGDVLGYAGRTYTNRTPKYLHTLNPVVITGYRVREATAPCVFVEGPFDGVNVHRAGFSVAVLSGTSGPGVEEFAARLSSQTPLVVLLDPEAEKEAIHLRERLRLLRLVGAASAVVLGQLPGGRDPGECSPEELRCFLTSIQESRP